MSLAILFHFLYAQHVSDINISIIRSLRLFCWITTLIELFMVRCVGVVSVLQASATTPNQPHRISNTHRTKNNTTNVAIQQNSRKLLMMDILMSEICWADKKWNKIASDIKLVFYSSTMLILLVPFVEMRKATISFVMSANTCVHMEQHGSQWTDFHEIWNPNLSRKFKSH